MRPKGRRWVESESDSSVEDDGQDRKVDWSTWGISRIEMFPIPGQRLDEEVEVGEEQEVADEQSVGEQNIDDGQSVGDGEKVGDGPQVEKGPRVFEKSQTVQGSHMNEGPQIDEDQVDEEHKVDEEQNVDEDQQVQEISEGESDKANEEAPSAAEQNPPFYSPTPLPSLMRCVNKESYYETLKVYKRSIPNELGGYPAKTWFNAEIDTLYFPSWCWEGGINAFDSASTQETKDSIKKLAMDYLPHQYMWERVQKGWINGQLNIGKFHGLDEYIAVQRNPDSHGCGCCHEFNSGPEIGVVSLQTTRFVTLVS